MPRLKGQVEVDLSGAAVRWRLARADMEELKKEDSLISSYFNLCGHCMRFALWPEGFYHTEAGLCCLLFYTKEAGMIDYALELSQGEAVETKQCQRQEFRANDVSKNAFFARPTAEEFTFTLSVKGVDQDARERERPQLCRQLGEAQAKMSESARRMSQLERDMNESPLAIKRIQDLEAELAAALEKVQSLEEENVALRATRRPSVNAPSLLSGVSGAISRTSSKLSGRT